MLLGLNRAIFLIVKNRAMNDLYNVLIVLDCYNKAGNILDKKKIVKITQKKRLRGRVYGYRPNRSI